MKKILAMLLCCAALLAGCGQQVPEKTDDGRLKIVATVFPAYDFARSAAGTFADVELLLPPGMDSHSYEPTPADILAVQECDLFIYLGGESDSWVETILSAVEPKGETLRMIDCVELLKEEHVEGMQTDPGHDHDHGEDCEEEHHHEEDAHDEDEIGLGEVVGMDEHVWTSPANAAAITRVIGERNWMRKTVRLILPERKPTPQNWTLCMRSLRLCLRRTVTVQLFSETVSPCGILRKPTNWITTRPSPAAAPRRNLRRQRWLS